ncbi:TAP-like protein-domain-containing protein [Biscogniauxia mediterranea]|nr:TAP-like protein-domain-containing protein [Biscogniauxia mediterranea]
MFRLNGIIPLLLLPIGYARAAALHQPHIRAEGLQWGPCELTTETDIPVECTKLAVPRDYVDRNSNETIDLDIIRVKAIQQPSKGSILLNFGGPGQDGLNNMVAYYPLQGPIIGEQHDLISWNPRGTGNTLRFQCYSDEVENSAAAAGLAGTLVSSSDTALGKVWAEAKVIADNCYSRQNATGGLVGMAYVARDMMQIVDALDEDGMLRYWGISGGTTLGSTVAAMFPDRIDKVILDGVMNVHQYYNSYEPESLAGADGAFEHFLSACLENRDTCALARNFTNVDELTAAMDELFDTLRNEPIPVWQLLAAVDYTIVKTTILSELYRPPSWPQLAVALNGLIDRNATDFVLQYLVFDAPTIPREAEAILGIRCGDKGVRASDQSEMVPVLDEFFKSSKWFGDFAFGWYSAVCAQWPMAARERYTGDFNVQTANPILFIGNPFDPITAFKSAQNMSSSFEGSVLLQHNGFGHTSLADSSNCTNAYIRSYFEEGTLPKPGSVCEPNYALFQIPH